MFKNFGKNFKKYFDYLMTVDYKELFINTVILLCIMALSGFVFVPIALIRDWVSNMVTMVTPFSENGVKIFNFVFLSISTICTFLGFVFLFNKRFNDMDAFKEQVKEGNKAKKSENKNEDKDELDMPKAKNEK